MNIEIFKALKPTYFISKVIGTSPYHLTRDESGNIRCRSPKNQIISSLIKIALLIFLLNPLQSHHLKIHSIKNVPVNIHAVEDWYTLICTCLSLVLCCWRNNDIFHFLNNINKVDSKLRKFVINIDYRALRLTILFTTIFNFFLLIFSTILDIIVNHQHSINDWIVWSYLINITIDCQMISLLLTIRTQFKSINSNLKGISNVLNANSKLKKTVFTRYVVVKRFEDVKILYKCRSELYEAFKSLNRFYGLHYVFKIPLFFLSVTSKPYYIVVSIIKCHCFKIQQIPELIWLFNNLWFISFIFIACDLIYTEVI